VEYQKMANFSCNFNGNPIPNITWSFGKESLNSSAKYDISPTTNVSILTVKNLGRDDSGSFSCHAENSLGSDSKASELIVLSKYYRSTLGVACVQALIPQCQGWGEGLHAGCIRTYEYSFCIVKFLWLLMSAL
jgi:hypothetical protein